MITYEDFIMLATLNLCPDLGMTEDHVVNEAVFGTEGDVTIESMKEAFANALAKGWLKFAPDITHRILVYTTEEGKRVFNENLEFWSNEATKIQKEKIVKRRAAREKKNRDEWFQPDGMPKPPPEQKGVDLLVLVLSSIVK